MGRGSMAVDTPKGWSGDGDEEGEEDLMAGVQGTHLSGAQRMNPPMMKETLEGRGHIEGAWGGTGGH